MLAPRRTPLLALVCLLCLHGCGEPDDPSPGDPGDAAAPASGSSPADGTNPGGGGGGDEPSPGAGGRTGDATAGASDGAGPGGGADGGTGDGTGDGTPPGDDSSAAPIDCAGTLPCRFESPGGGFAITLTAADGEALDGSGPLRIDFSAEALSRDVLVGVDRASHVVAGGEVLAADTLRLGGASIGDARDEAAFTLLAGVPINGHATFSGTLVGNPAALERVTLALSEAGAPRHVSFADVPLGPEPSLPVECLERLPCHWRSADGSVMLTLTDVAPLYWNRSTRLVVDWSLASTRALELATFLSGLVTGTDGEALELYGVELAGEQSRDATPLVRPLAAGETLAGRLVLRRVPPDEVRGLARVAPGIAERRAPRAPRWRPVFLNVPIVR